MRLSLPTLLLKFAVCTCGLALLLISTALSAQQEYRYKADTLRKQVIAVSGLNLRDAPGAHGRVLTKVPYLDTVTILNDTAYAPVNLDSYEVRTHNYWIKASYGDQTGYLFDAYLYYPTRKVYSFPAADYPAGINTNYQLFTNMGSSDLNYDHFSYEWYGLYDRPGGCSVRSISPSYRFYEGEIEASLEMTVNNSPFPNFFIASRKGLKTGARPGTIIRWEGNLENTQAASDAVCRDYNISSSRPETTGAWASSQELTLTIGNTSQHLNPGARAGSAVYVEAATDIDGDGQTDFIISYDAKGYDSTYIYVLFLSSEARAGELVHPVAMQYIYDGC